VAVSEAFSAAKEVKIGSLESAYIKRFDEPAELYAKHQSASLAIVSLPRFALEAIAFGGMMLIVLYLMLQGASFTDALPVISLYAFAGYRLVPAAQQIYGAISQLRIMGPVIDALYTEMTVLKISSVINASSNPIILNQSIALNNIHYTYPNADHPALDGISITIPAQRVIGLVGSTGCGKTTTVDLILGLLEPQQGTLCVDGEVVNRANIREWQKSIGYVPQQIYLSDDTVASNIAFGIDESDINQDAVARAAKIANLHDFVINDLPNGYETRVGERGVRLSGGQRQRIGIARALYHNPQVLILDEATSALDNLTEFAVMEAINKLRHDITIILIAHRLSTVRECDQIYLMEKGKVIAQGSYDQLSASSKVFQEMTKVSR
jgi:ABC-type multidrug transport system fused ATPase/permease subunit